MKRHNRFFQKIIIAFMAVFFLNMGVLPYIVMACPGNWSGHQQAFGSGVTVGDELTDSELVGEPIHFACSKGDPVYLHSGEFFYECPDLFIPGRGMDLEIKHVYRSGKSYKGLFGQGWTINYHYRLLEQENGNVTILKGNGRSDEYVLSGGNFVPPPGIFELLIKNGDNTWTLTQAQGTRLEFDSFGRITAMVDRNDNQIAFTYDAGGALPIIGKSVTSQNPTQAIVVAVDYRITTITDTVGRDVNLFYNTNGRLDRIVDYAGREVKFEYDDVADNLIKITHPVTTQYPQGLTKTFTYDNQHRLTSITDPKGQTFVTNHYDADGRVIQQDLGNGSLGMNYTLNQTTVTDRRGFVTTYTFNENGNPTKVEQFTSGLRVGDPASFITTHTYNADLLLTSTTFPEGNGIVYVYDENNGDARARGNLLQIRRKADMAAADSSTDLVTQMTYDPQFNQIKTFTDPKGQTTTFTFDYELGSGHPQFANHGNVVLIEQSVVTAGIPTTGLSYNTHGQITQVIDPNGNTTQLAYFPATGYLQSIAQDPAGINAVTQFTYDVYGNPDTVTDPNNHVTDFAYNELRWLIEETNPLGFKTKFTYDQNENVTKIERQVNQTATQWQVTEFTYDVLNNLKTVKDPLNRITTMTYDTGENLIARLDAAGQTTAFSYDERNLLFEVTDANIPAGLTQYDYDANGNLKTITDANNNPTDYEFDGYDRLVKQTYADTSFAAFSYDKNSNLTTNTTPSGAVINFEYDALNRQTAKRFPATAGLDTTFTYDLGSRLLSANNTAAQNSFGYDTLNRVTQNSQTVNTAVHVLNYVYDKAGNQTKVTYPSGKVVDNAFDALDRLDLVKVGGITLADYDYDPLDRRSTKTLATSNQQRATYSFDIANQLTSMTSTVLPSTNISIHSYPVYDAVSNRKQYDRTFQTSPLETINYSYNTIYELTQSHNVTTSQSHDYDYDNVGNREVADSVTYTFNNLNQYNSVGGSAYTYDGNGNLTNDGTNTYTYDEQNRLTTFTNGIDSASYAYDAFNRRVSKTVNGTTTYFVYDDQEVIAEYNASGRLEAEYVLGPQIDEVLTMERGGSTYYYHTDGLGSVTEITNSSGNVVENYTYDPYGNISIFDSSHQQLAASNINNPYMFTGRRYDDESGTYYYRARMYDPTIGRFFQRDPIGYADSMNLYAYVGNSPVNFIDPYGLLTVHIWNYRGKNEAWGHASITLDNGRHISWWPGSDRQGGLIPNVYSADPRANQTFQRDIELEGQKPDADIYIPDLDEKAIEKWWDEYKDSNQWKTLSNNCSTVASEALKKGGGKAGFFDSHKLIWTPNDVKNFAEEIKKRSK